MKPEWSEYETIYASGGICIIEEIEEIIFPNDLCDRMSMDAMSSGNLAGFAIETHRQGNIDLEID